MASKKSELLPLNPEEQSRPYAKYYRDPVLPDPEHLAMMDTPCEPSKALHPEQMNDLLHPGDPAGGNWMVQPAQRSRLCCQPKPLRKHHG
jgi:hypothetical protein